MLSAIRKGLFSFIGSKGASANYVHAEDVVQAIELCLHHPKAANQTYIISAWATIEEMVGGLALGAGLNYPSRRIPITGNNARQRYEMAPAMAIVREQGAGSEFACSV